MECLNLIVILVASFFAARFGKIILKAAKRVNLLYDYFIVRGEASAEDIKRMARELSSRPNPNDGGGCPKESELQQK